MNNLILIINPNSDNGNFNQEITPIKEIFVNECNDRLSVNDISESNACDYIYRNYNKKEIAELLINFYLSKNKTVLVDGLLDIEVIEYLKQNTDYTHLLIFTPSITSIETNNINAKTLNVYMWGDYYLNTYLQKEIVINQYNRFLGLVDGDDAVYIPTNQEINMYSAYAAMYHSHCLSRAVGACITTLEHEIITTGWNDVPKAGGGVYGLDNNNHCFKFKNPDQAYANEQIGICYKDFENKAIIDEIKSELKGQGIEIGEKEEYIIQAIGKLQIKGLLEFSRSVHAEMHTIIKAAQLVGNKIKDSILYVTAFPCHNCARHIVLSGVKIVYFLEPFIKSRAIKLHNDSLKMYDELPNILPTDKVLLIPYQGVGGRSFESFFRRTGDLKLKVKSGLEYKF